MDLGLRSEALSTYLVARRLREESGDVAGLATVECSIGLLLIDGSPHRAVSHFLAATRLNNALHKRGEVPDFSGYAAALDEYCAGECDIELDRYADADAAFSSAAEVLAAWTRQGAEPTGYYVAAVAGKATALLAEGRRGDAVEILKGALAYVDVAGRHTAAAAAILRTLSAAERLDAIAAKNQGHYDRAIHDREAAYIDARDSIEAAVDSGRTDAILQDAICLFDETGRLPNRDYIRLASALHSLRPTADWRVIGRYVPSSYELTMPRGPATSQSRQLLDEIVEASRRAGVSPRARAAACLLVANALSGDPLPAEREAATCAGVAGSPDIRWRAEYAMATRAEHFGLTARSIALYEASVDDIDAVRGNVEPGEARQTYFATGISVCRHLAELRLRAACSSGDYQDAVAAVTALERIRGRRLLDMVELWSGAVTNGDRSLKPLVNMDCIPAGGAVLDYFVGSQEAYVVVIRKRSPASSPALGVIRLPASPIRLAEAASRLSADMSVQEGAAPESEQILTDLGILGSWLLPRGVLGELSGCKSVIVVPDDGVASVPYAALITGSRASEPEYAIDAFAVSYAQSLAVLGTQTRLRVPVCPIPMLAIGGCHPGDPGANLDQIAGLFPGSPRASKRSDATTARFQATAPNARFIYIATHADVGLSPTDCLFELYGDGTDGQLTAEAVSGLALNTDTAVLEACDSDLGANVEGEGIEGLAWAFEHAGCRSVIASMWQVDIPCSDALMAEFWRSLALSANLSASEPSGMDKASILREAIRSFRKQHPEYECPYYWAAFGLVGDPGPVVRPSGALRRLRPKPRKRLVSPPIYAEAEAGRWGGMPYSMTVFARPGDDVAVKVYIENCGFTEADSVEVVVPTQGRLSLISGSTVVLSKLAGQNTNHPARLPARFIYVSHGKLTFRLNHIQPRDSKYITFETRAAGTSRTSTSIDISPVCRVQGVVTRCAPVTLRIAGHSTEGRVTCSCYVWDFSLNPPENFLGAEKLVPIFKDDPVDILVEVASSNSKPVRNVKVELNSSVPITFDPNYRVFDRHHPEGRAFVCETINDGGIQLDELAPGTEGTLGIHFKGRLWTDNPNCIANIAAKVLLPGSSHPVASNRCRIFIASSRALWCMFEYWDPRTRDWSLHPNQVALIGDTLRLRLTMMSTLTETVKNVNVSLRTNASVAPVLSSIRFDGQMTADPMNDLFGPGVAVTDMMPGFSQYFEFDVRLTDVPQAVPTTPGIALSGSIGGKSFPPTVLSCAPGYARF